MRASSWATCLFLTLQVASFNVIDKFTAETNPNYIDHCENQRNYIVQKNSEGIVLSSKHIADGNCIQVNAYHNEDFFLKFYYKNDRGNYTTIKYDADHTQNTTKAGIRMGAYEFNARLVFTDKSTGQATVYVKTNQTQLIFTVPFDYDYLEIEKNGQKAVSMWLNTEPPSNGMVTFYILDYLVLLAELCNVMILVDLGLVIVMVYRRYNLEHELHSKIMWAVLVMELLSLFYFLWRYQFYFWHVPVFFYFFVSEIFINVFSIANNSLGVFLHTAIFEKHICQNIPAIKGFHRLFGYVTYALMKLSLAVKLIIFVYVAELTPDWIMISIVAANPFIWLFYFLSTLLKSYAQ